MSNHSTIDLIKQKIGIVEVVSRYLKLTPSGKDFKGLSPFVSEKTPSFFVSPSKDLYYCFSSQKGGDIFSFIQEIEKTDFKEALKILADMAGIDLEQYKTSSDLDGESDKLYKIMDLATSYYQRVLKTNKEAGDYLKSRGLNMETIEKFRIGFAPLSWSIVTNGLLKKGFKKSEIIESGLVIPKKNNEAYDRFRGRIMFPISDYRGRVVGFSARILPSLSKTKTGESVAKYINSPETKLYHKSKILFAGNFAKDSWRLKKRAILVEGQMDTIMAHQFGFLETVGLSGTALSQDQLTFINRFTDNLIIALDSDRAGINATHLTVLKALELGFKIKVAMLPAGLDPADVLVDDPKIFENAIEKAVPYIQFRLDLYGRHQDSTGYDLLEIIGESLYPYIKAVKSEITKDQLLQLISERVNVPIEKVRIDFEKNFNNIPENKIYPLDNAVYKNMTPYLWDYNYNYNIKDKYLKKELTDFPILLEYLDKNTMWQDFLKWNELTDISNLPESSFILQKFDEKQVIINIEDSLRIKSIKRLKQEMRDLSIILKNIDPDSEEAQNKLRDLQVLQGKLDRLKIIS